MDKILIIGANGMAGHMIKEYLLEKKYDVYSTFRTLLDNQKLSEKDFILDICDKKKLNEILGKVRPKFVINCVGVLNQFAEENPDIAIYINGYIPHYLDRLSKYFDYKLIQISTDCVFSGKKGGYSEKDFKDAESYYGKSKAIGEIDNNRTLTIRTSIIGPDINKAGIGLFNWFMKQKGEIKGYSNVFWTGVTTLELAKAIEFSFSKKLVGLHHLVNNTRISKYELLKLFQRYTNKDDVTLNICNSYSSDKSLIKTNLDFDYNVKTYEKMIEEMMVWIKKSKKEYPFLGEII